MIFRMNPNRPAVLLGLDQISDPLHIEKIAKRRCARLIRQMTNHPHKAFKYILRYPKTSRSAKPKFLPKSIDHGGFKIVAAVSVRVLCLMVTKWCPKVFRKQ